MRFPFWRRARQEELGEEIESHLRMAAREREERGEASQQAEQSARREFGNAGLVREVTRDQWGWRWLETLFQDLRHALRMLRKSPGFTAVVVLTLALGIGANTAIFSIVDAVLLRPLPYKNPSRLVLLTEYHLGSVETMGVPYPAYRDWKAQTTAFSETAAYWQTGASDDLVLGGAASAERVRYTIVTNNFFSILGVQPALGRGFVAAEETPGSANVFLASDRLWRASFGADPRAIGKSFLVDGENFVLVGVMPAGFDFPQDYDVWMPIGSMSAREASSRISHPFRILARMRLGVDISQARLQMDALQARLAKTYPATDAEWRVRARSLADVYVGNVRASLLILFGAVSLILLIACANAANLILGRAIARKSEFAIRAALGGGRARLMRQAFTESFVLASASALAAILLASWALRAILFLSAGRIPRMEAFQLNAPVLAFVIMAALATTMLVGFAPALQISDANLRESLAEGQRSGAIGAPSQRLRNALVIAEVALTLPLLCGAGLLVSSFQQLNRVDLGFQPEHLLTFKVALPGAQYTGGKQSGPFLARLLDKLQSLPGVESAAATTTLPLSGEMNWDGFKIAGRTYRDSSQIPTAEWRGISANYFQAIGASLLRGREFGAGDMANPSRVVVINQAMAAQFWPGTAPVGQQIINPYNNSSREIVGVVGNIKSFGQDAASPPEMYTLMGPTSGFSYINFVVRSATNSASLIPAVRAEVASLDKNVAMYNVAPMDDLLARSVAPRRFNSFLFTLFAALALALAIIGIYGLLSFNVNSRQHEIGVRMALGAQPRDVLQMIVIQGMKLLAVALAVGLVVSFALTRLMAKLLFGVSATDLGTFAAVIILLALTALAACCIPARRAMRVDPMVALRYE
ncbi:MAG: ABC transporter permease [Candidatus Acidiferrales bacterium]